MSNPSRDPYIAIMHIPRLAKLYLKSFFLKTLYHSRRVPFVFSILILSILYAPLYTFGTPTPANKPEMLKVMREIEENQVDKGKLEEAIQIYQDYIYQKKHVGRIHLRLGQLFDSCSLERD